MRRLLTIVCALSIVALMAMPALAEVQNIKISGGIDIRAIARDNMAPSDSGAGRALGTFAETTTQDLYNSVVTLNVDADLTDNVAAHIGLFNERDWGVTGAGIWSNSAYITLKEMMYSPLTVVAGRTSVVIADGLVVGDGVTNENTGGLLAAAELSPQNEFDTIHAILDYDPLTLIIGTLKLAEGLAGTFGDDIDGYLVDGIYKFEDYNAVLDTYLVAAHYASPGVGLTGPDGTSNKTCDVYALATRLTMEPTEGLMLDAGIAIQSGDYMTSRTVGVADRGLDAMAFNVGLDYAVDAEYSPKVGVKYIYRSGDSGDGVGDFEGWLPLAEGQVLSVIVDPNTNTNSFNLNASIVPADRLTLGVDVWFFNLAKALATQTAAMSTKKDVGTEIDLALKYAYTEDVSMGLTLAYFMPGDYYRNGFDKTATEIIGSVGVKF
ncbi:MAG: alginate export family protein [Candidatus Omnitrophota bacterium]